jgi:hypothetical protein
VLAATVRCGPASFEEQDGFGHRPCSLNHQVLVLSELVLMPPLPLGGGFVGLRGWRTRRGSFAFTSDG